MLYLQYKFEEVIKMPKLPKKIKNIIDESPLVKNIDKFNYWLEALPFYMNIEKEGVILNEF